MRLTPVIVIATLLSLLLSANAGAVVFSNTAPIAVGPAAGPATPYPSPITVSGLTGTISDVNVTLLDLTHTFPDDVDVLLAGPGGQSLILMGDAGDDTDANMVDLTFDQQAANEIPATGALTSGASYRPANHPEDTDLGCLAENDAFPAPAPAPSSTILNVFNGTSPNGTWSLYVIDDCTADGGSIQGGWSLDILTVATSVRLRSFAARPFGAGTLLRWSTASEASVLGFNLYRRAGGRSLRLNRALIPARSATGAAYRFLDRAARGKALYRLQVVELNGSRSWAAQAWRR